VVKNYILKIKTKGPNYLTQSYVKDVLRRASLFINIRSRSAMIKYARESNMDEYVA